MDLNLQPQMADEKIFEGEGGAYYSWSTSKSPLLSEAKVGGGKLVLQPRGFALPHYADSAKIGYVSQGCCTVGMVTSKEKVLKIKKGDAIPVPIGVVSWWFNGGDTECVIVFLGETSKALIPGQFTYFFLTGTLGILGAFSPQVISRTYNINENETKTLTKSQTGVLITKLEEKITMPHPGNDNSEILFADIDNALPDIEVKGGGRLTALTEANFPLLGKIGLSAKFVKLNANAILAPMCMKDSSVQVNYVTKGSGWIQIVGASGKAVLDTKVQAGELFIVPAFHAAAKIADGEGMECFSVITSSEPLFGQLTGNTSVWKALSPVVLQASLNVTPEFVKLFETKIEKSTILIPPDN